MSSNLQDDPDFTGAFSKPRSRPRFTLLHLVAAVGIIGLLIGLMLPARRTARGAAKRLQCQSNLKQIALALQGYERAYKALPPAHTVDASGQPLHSWRTLILPFLDEQELYETIDLSKPWNDPANARAFQTTVRPYQCPEAGRGDNTTSYLAIAAPNGCFRPGQPRRLAEITDPHALTLMLIEAGPDNAVPWMRPVDADESLVMGLGPTSKLNHAGGMNWCFVDGGIRYMSAETSAEIRRAVMSIAGNEVLRQSDLE